MNIQPVFTRYDINRKIPFDWSSPIVVDHVEDYETRFIEVYVYESVYNKQVDLKGTTIIARIVAALSTEKILLNDNVACTLNGSGNIIIPIDGKVIETLASTLLVEVRITQGEQALVLPFPLYVQMRGSILDDAGVAPESRGTIPELLEAAIAALEEAKNYENLENKPQINGHTLSGNKTSDVLGLQKKLTAGQNITLESDGTISASGGVTSYNNLTDKPNVSNYAPSQREQTHPLTGTLDLYPFTSTYDSSTKKNSLRLDKSDLFEAFRTIYTIANFEDLPTSHGVFACNYANSGYFKPLPDFIKPLSNFFVVYNLYTGTSQGLAQLIFWVDKNSGKSKSAFRVGANNFYSVSPWQEIGGSSQIVSGAVNQNGTITFTDSDGNTFTTTGASVIGPQGNPGQDYVLTEQDKSDIADIVLGELPTTEGVLYGNTNN